MQIYTIISPLAVPVSTRKHFILNMNNYRNAHYQTLAKAKRVYTKIVGVQVREMPPFTKAECFFTLYHGNKGKVDVGNVCSIHEKFLLDTIVTGGKLVDDQARFVPKCHYEFGGVDYANPRVEVEIVEISGIKLISNIDAIYGELLARINMEDLVAIGA